MDDLFKRKSEELCKGLEEQQQAIAQLQKQLEALSADHQKKADACNKLRECQEQGDKVISELRAVLRKLSEIDPEILQAYLGRVNEVLLGAGASKPQQDNALENKAVEPVQVAQPQAQEKEPEEDVKIPDTVPANLASNFQEFVVGDKVKVLSDKFGVAGSIGEIKIILDKPNGTKYKVSLDKGLFTFSREDFEPYREKTEPIHDQETLPF